MGTQRNTYVEESVDDSTPKRDVPALPRSSVYRDRLRVPEPTDLATELGKGSIVVVTGPGGAGKSTLMAAWASELSSRGAGIGWASLGPDDNDPGSLWTTVLGALRDAVARGAQTAYAVVEQVYADVPRSVWPAAELSVRAQLEYLREHG